MLETSHRTTTKMSQKRSALRTNPKARDGLNSVLTKLRDGLEGRPGSVREVLRQVEELELTVKRQPILRKTLFNMSMKEAYLEVIDLPGKEVAAAIEQVMIAVARNILDGDGFGFSLPCRGNGDQVYVDELDRIVLKDKYALISFSSTSSVRKVAILTRVMQLIHGVLCRGIHVTKRDLFYTDVKLFRNQKESDAVLDDISCLLGCTRNSLHVVASEKGVVVGKLLYMKTGMKLIAPKWGLVEKQYPAISTRWRI